MTRFLPPHATIDHLKNEAKALRRAHRERKSDICAVLRNLHRFRSAGDEEIYAAEVALTEIQFALAIDYGFPSWNELRKAVLLVRPGEGYHAEAQGDAFVLPNCPVGNNDSNRFASVLSMAFSYVGATASYTDVIGDSGLAFILQADSIHTPYDRGGRTLDIGWWPIDPWGAMLRLNFLRDVYGFGLRQLPTDFPEYRANAGRHYKKHHEAKVTESLQAGYPVITMGSDICLTVGFDKGEPPLLGQLSCSNKPLIGRLQTYPWTVMVMEEHGESIDRRQTDREALDFAVRLGHDEVDLEHLPGKSGGARSWRLWVDQLANEELCGPHYYHANVLYNLRLNRSGAVAYLRGMAERHEAPIRHSIFKAASLYEDVLAKLSTANLTEDLPKSAEKRESLTGVIKESGEIEKEALKAMAEAAKAI